ncbi:MAG: hypothetical protein IM546_17170, partial [Pseudanabaena sp. M065S1SP2A07QC]|nr:hypothetical protein [Pseudanabaena sp. M065S1SP2A07QC]
MAERSSAIFGVLNCPSYLLRCYTKDKSRVAARKMNDEIVAIYCLCDDILRAMNHQSDIQQQM